MNVFSRTVLVIVSFIIWMAPVNAQSDGAALFREAFSRLLLPFRASLERDLSDLPPGKRLEEQIEASERFAREHSPEIGAFVRWAVESPAFREHVITALFDAL